MKEPRRHNSSSRNRRKARRQIARIMDELLYLQDKVRKAGWHLEYAIKKANKLRNRLQSEK